MVLTQRCLNTSNVPDAGFQHGIIGAKEYGDQRRWPHALREHLGQEVQRPGRVVSAVTSQHDVCLSHFPAKAEALAYDFSFQTATMRYHI